MENLTENALEEVRSAMEIVEESRADHSLSKIERLDLEKASLRLRRMERNIIRLTQQQLVDTLTEDAMILEEISVNITQSAEKLKKVSEGISKATKVVEVLIKAVTASLSAGLI